MGSLKDIADLTGVSVSTVSRALSGNSAISEKTRKLVENVVADLNYSVKRPEMVKTIGVIVPEIISNYYAELFQSIESCLSAKGYCTIIGVSAFAESNILRIIEVMNRQNVDGIICSDLTTDAIDNSNIIEAIYRLQAPVVLISESGVEAEKCDCIRINYESGIKKAIYHLLEKGHNKIGVVGDKPPAARLKTILRLLSEAGVTIPDNMIKIGDNRFELVGYEQMKLLLNEPERPTAVIALYDQIAIGALKAIDEEGLRVPEDIAIMGYDNIAIDEYLPKKLTTITNPVAEMGRIATRILFNRIDSIDEPATQHVLLQSEFIIRETT